MPGYYASDQIASKTVSLGRKEAEHRVAIRDATNPSDGFLSFLQGDHLLVLLKDKAGFGIAIRMSTGEQGLFELKDTEVKRPKSPSGSMSVREEV